MNGAWLRNRYLRRILGVAALVIAALGAILAFQIVKDPVNVPGELPEADKRRIVRLTRWRTLTRAVELSREGDFAGSIRALRVLPKQQLNELRKNPWGTYRAYVVVFSTNEPDGSGFYAWWRHELIKTNGDWVIVRSY